MFEGLFGPWHLLILAVVVLVVVGPRKVADRWHDGADALRQWTDPDEREQERPAAAQPVPKRRPLLYRLGRRLRKAGR